MFRLNCHLLAMFVVACFSLPASASVVRLDVAYGSQPVGAVYIELFDADANKTVLNFLKYVENATGERRYDGTFIHRSVPGFILQGGGYIFDPVQGALHIDEYTPVVNEFDAARSNLRGTISMAKLGNDPDSATSEWFINLADNSANLDSQNGGFTVFGQVLGNGMDVIDAIAAQQVVNAGGPFTDLPVVDNANPITADSLVTITRIIADPPSAISADSVNQDFGLVVLNSGPGSRSVTIQNLGSEDLILGAVGDIDALAPPFRIAPGGDGCSGQVLAATVSCSITVEFEPVALGEVADSFNVPSSDVVQPSLLIDLRGTGAPASPVLEVLPQTTLDFGAVGTGEPRTRGITLRNVGGGQLEPLPPVINGVDAAVFSLSADGCTGTMLNTGESCSLSVKLSSLSIGSVSALIALNANPGGQAAQLSLGGTVTLLQPGIDLPDTLAMGDTRGGRALTASLPVTNRGIDDLFISAIELVGADAVLFSVGTECVNRAITASSTCQVQFGFSAVPIGAYSATARLRSNDPDRPVIDVPLTVTVSEDGDGIPAAIEAAAPNSGDGNQDGIQDSLQERVASLRDVSGRFVTLEVPEGMLLSGVAAIDNPSPTTTPVVNVGTLEFRNGFFSFTIDNVPIGGDVTVNFYLPPGQSANRYFKFGRLPGQTAQTPGRWYDFVYDSQSRTGAQYFDDRVTLNFIDGGRGDNDLSANGRITDPGGPALVNIDSGSSGGGGCALPLQSLTNPGNLPVDMPLLLFGVFIFRLSWSLSKKKKDRTV